MAVQDLVTLLQNHGWAVGIVLIILGSIKIPTYEIRIIPYLCKKLLREFGNLINENIMERVEKLEDEFHKYSVSMQQDFRAYALKTEEEFIDRARSRMLRFSDEIIMGVDHSKEHFDEILKDIDNYEQYCDDHPDYENNRAVLAIQTIKEEYTYCLKHHKFLSYTKK